MIHKRPWAARRLEDRDGSYADYAAWESWLAERMHALEDNARHPMPVLLHVLEDVAPMLKDHLYLVMCHMCDKSEDVT